MTDSNTKRFEKLINHMMQSLFLHSYSGTDKYTRSLEDNPDVLFGSLWFRADSDIDGYGVKFDSHIDFCPSKCLRSRLIYLQAPIIGINLQEKFYKTLYQWIDLPETMKYDTKDVMRLMGLGEKE